MSRVVHYQWDGEAMRPNAFFKNYCAEYFTVGTSYALEEIEHRNIAAHRGFFASLNSAFENLRERGDADLFPSKEILRYWALTYTPFCHVRSYAAASKREAMRIAEWLAKDERYCRVSIDEANTVWHYLPDSQAVAAMPSNRKFIASMHAVMVVLAQKLGVDVDALWEAGRNAA